MAITPLTVTIDLNPSYKKIPAVYVSQLDNNLRSLAITVQDGGVNYDVASSGYDVYVEGTKPDKHGFSYKVTDIGGTVVGSVVTVPMQTQMTCVQGMVPTEIVLKSGSDRIGSANFLLVVERAGLAEDVDVSETDIPAYIDGAQQAADDAEDAKDLAVSAAETAQGVLESIPEDYSDLSNDVDDLKSAFTDLNGYMNNIYSIPWRTGYYNASGTYVSNANQLTTDMFRVPTGAKLTLVNPLYGCYLKEFKKEGSTYTRLRNVGGNSQHSTTILDTNPNYFYIAGLYNSSAVDIANSGTLTLTSPIGSLYEQVDYNTYNSYHLPLDGSYKTVFTNGLYNSSGNYSNSSIQISTNMLQFPKGTALTFLTTANDIGVYIQEFAKNGNSYTRLRNLGGNSYRTISTVAQSNDYYYVFTCTRSTGLTPSDADLLSIIAKANTNGLDVSLASNEMTINTGTAKYVFKRVTDNSINVDTWRLYSGLLTAGNFTMWSDSDAEGAIKISGESDYVSGYHGDEIMVSAACYADGKAVDLTGTYHENVKNLTIYVTSNVYHVGGGSVAFVRHKKLVFEGNKVKISNCYIPQSNLSIEMARLAMFQCYKASGNTAVFTNYSVNTDFMNYAVADIASNRPSASDKMTEATLNTIYGNIVFKSLMTSGQNYKGMVSDFSDQGRVKFYFDTIASTTSVSANENIMSEFEFAIS